MHTILDWRRIDTVLLDMDGTLLDLHFDNHFWLEHVPRRYAEKHGLSFEQARDTLLGRYRAVEGTIDWYCLDYWSDELQMDIAQLKEEVDHLIAVHPHVIEFLEALKRAGKRRILVTNAHGKAIALKMRRTPIGEHLDSVICAHEFGAPKEDQRFWERLQGREPFARQSTLLIDDSLAVLRSAKRYGIEHLLAVRRPDSKQAPREVSEFPSVEHFRELLPQLRG
ncbi:MAG: GMP/IMP nucleotidase [Gammaproteobacteria bacterium]